MTEGLRDVPDGVVFDLDGTLLDTETLARDSFFKACDDLGLVVEAHIYESCVGASFEATQQILLEGYGPQFPFEAVAERWNGYYRGHVYHKPVDIKPGVVELLERLRVHRIPVALATASHRPTVTQKLKHSGLDEYFEHWVCGNESARNKPHPDPYLDAVALLGLTPSVCWALEDSDNGVRSAYHAGLTVFQIPDGAHPSQEVRDFGHEILTSARDLLDRL